jgi:plastocyanin
MSGSRKIAAMLVGAALLLTVPPAVAQDDAATDEMTGATVEVSGVDYAFEGLPTSLPAGTSLTFTNDGVEVHEMIVVKINDEDATLEELQALPEEEAAELAEFKGFLFSFPGTSADGSIAVDAPGRYVAFCQIHQGSDPAAFEALGIDVSTFDPETVDRSTLSAEVQELLATIDASPTHEELGMIQEFTVTEAGTEPGPLPEMEAEDETA